MKLRNKKTGESGELHYYPDKAYHFAVSAKDPTHTGIYKTLGELLHDWEDFIVHVPPEPLIKDPKIRKAVRAWAEANSLEVFQYRDADIGARFQGADFEYIQFNPWKADNLEDFREYTISELCGEEEE